MLGRVQFELDYDEPRGWNGSPDQTAGEKRPPLHRCLVYELVHVDAAFFNCALGCTRRLTSVCLRESALGPGGAQALASVLQVCAALVSLDVSDNLVGSAGARHLAALIEPGALSPLRNLNVECNSLCDEGAKFLAAPLARNGVLESLSLSFNPIGTQGLRHVCDALTQARLCTALARLSVEGSYWHPEGEEILLGTLRYNATLREVQFWDSQLTRDRAAITTLLNRNHVGLRPAEVSFRTATPDGPLLVYFASPLTGDELGHHETYTALASTCDLEALAWRACPMYFGRWRFVHRGGHESGGWDVLDDSMLCRAVERCLGEGIPPRSGQYGVGTSTLAEG